MNKFQMYKCLGFFVAEVKNLTGDDYYPNTLYELVTSLQHHIRSNGTPINFLEDNNFYEMRQILDAKMKELSAKGLGSKKRQTEIITEEEEKPAMGSQYSWGRQSRTIDTYYSIFDWIKLCFTSGKGTQKPTCWNSIPIDHWEIRYIHVYYTISAFYCLTLFKKHYAGISQAM